MQHIEILAERLSGYFLKISKHCSGGGGEASMSLKTLQKLLNWENTVAKAWTKIQTQSASPPACSLENWQSSLDFHS